MVRLDDLLVVRTPASETLRHEVLEDLLPDVDEVCERPHDYHIRGAGVARGAGELVERHSEALTVGFEIDFLGVIDDDPGVGDFILVSLVGVFVERDKHVQLIARAEHRLVGDPSLGPCRASPDLRWERGEGLHVVSHLRVGLGETFGGRDHTLAALSGEADYEICLLQFTHSPLALAALDASGALRHAS